MPSRGRSPTNCRENMVCTSSLTLTDRSGGASRNYFGGVEKLLSFGAYPDVPLTLARERREDAHRLLAAGTKPSVHRRAEAGRKNLESFNTFRGVATEWLRMKEEIMAPVTYNSDETSSKRHREFWAARDEEMQAA
jgi:hypothetical protein